MSEGSPDRLAQAQARRRRSAGNPNMSLNLDVGSQVTEGVAGQCTPSPSYAKVAMGNERPSSAARLEFIKKQQSFDVQVIQIEECEEEEIAVSDDEEGNEEEGASAGGRPVTPMPITDFGANVSYTETPLNMNFLQVTAPEPECVTDVSDADTEEE